MKVVIGAGTPGKQYQNVRNNAGFRVCDALAMELGLVFDYDGAVNADVAVADTTNGELLVVKPRSGYRAIGESYAAVVAKRGVDPQDVLVAYDEYSMPLGAVDMTNENGGAVNAAIKSINDHGGEPTMRLRFGIGSRLMGCLPPEDFAAVNFSPQGIELFDEEVIPLALDEIHAFVTR